MRGLGGRPAPGPGRGPGATGRGCRAAALTIPEPLRCGRRGPSRAGQWGWPDRGRPAPPRQDPHPAPAPRPPLRPPAPPSPGPSRPPAPPPRRSGRPAPTRPGGSSSAGRPRPLRAPSELAARGTEPVTPPRSVLGRSGRPLLPSGRGGGCGGAGVRRGAARLERSPRARPWCARLPGWKGGPRPPAPRPPPCACAPGRTACGLTFPPPPPGELSTYPGCRGWTRSPASPPLAQRHAEPLGAGWVRALDVGCELQTRFPRKGFP